MEKPLVSIICTVFNHERYLRDCLDGFVMQKTDFRFEAIVHDDASTDGSADIIREYAKKYPDIIKPIYEKENQYSKKDGSLSRIMYSACMGKYVAFCEGDDYWIDPYKLQKQYEALESHPKCSICFTRVQPVSVDKSLENWKIPFSDSWREGLVTMKDYTDEEFYNTRWCFHTSSFFVKANLLLPLNEFRKNEFRNFPFGDMIIILYALLNGEGYYIPIVGSCYRLMSGGYNSRIGVDKSFAISQAKKLNLALIDFDKLTSFHFHKAIIQRIGVNTLVAIIGTKRQFWKALMPKYWYVYHTKGIKWTIHYFIGTFGTGHNLLSRIRFKNKKR